MLVLLVLASCGGGNDRGYATLSKIERNDGTTQSITRANRQQRAALRKQLLASLQEEPDAKAEARTAEQAETSTATIFPSTARGFETVALLAPFSGSEAVLGTSLLNAASLALFEHPDVRISLLSVDTAAGIQTAVEMAQSQGSKALIGPVRASEVKQVERSLRRYGASVFSLSNSQAIAKGNRGIIYPMGFVPEDQVQVILDTLARQGRKKIAVIAPDNQYGRLIAELAKSYTNKTNGLFLQQSLLYPPNLQDFTLVINRLTDIDAVLLAPVKPQNLRIIASQLDSVDLAYPKVQIAGLQLWDNFGDLEKEPSLNEAIWVSSKNNQAQEFRRKYRAVFKQEPHGLASISYDIMKMMIAQSRNGTLSFRPNQSFAGINGELTLLQNGTVKRNYYLRQIIDGEDSLLR